MRLEELNYRTGYERQAVDGRRDVERCTTKRLARNVRMKKKNRFTPQLRPIDCFLCAMQKNDCRFVNTFVSTYFTYVLVLFSCLALCVDRKHLLSWLPPCFMPSGSVAKMSRGAHHRHKIQLAVAPLATSLMNSQFASSSNIRTGGMRIQSSVSSACAALSPCKSPVSRHAAVATFHYKRKAALLPRRVGDAA